MFQKQQQDDKIQQCTYRYLYSLSYPIRPVSLVLFSKLNSGFNRDIRNGYMPYFLLVSNDMDVNDHERYPTLHLDSNYVFIYYTINTDNTA